MAINRFSVHIGTKGKASPHFSYITASGKYDKKKGVERVGYGNMPSWAKGNPAKFWAMADEHERANGQTYKEHILSIPREMPTYLRIRFIRKWIDQEIGDKHPYSFAIHETTASDGKTNPHAHVMYCPRELDGIDRNESQFFKRYNAKHPERGGARKAETGLSRGEMKKNLLEQRQRWEDTIKEFAREWDLDLYSHYTPNPTPNKSMSEIQKAQKLDDMLENHRWNIPHKSVPPFVPSAPPPAPEPIRPQGESLAEKYARENAENARMRYDTPQATPTPRQPEKRPQRENTGYEYDFGM